jgi:exodeoxyribonuclease VII large subunit
MVSGIASAESTEQQPLSVSQLTEQVKDLLEGSFPSVWVEGEISNLSRPQSGHCYLSIKDERAQLRAVLWRGTAERLPVKLVDGMEVICQGGLDVYAPRGSYQLVIRKVLPKGEGGLQKALRRLRDKLSAEGLFDKSQKKPLPRFPRRIAVVTSPTGAAIHDFLQVLQRRWRAVDVLLVPVRVQGSDAAAEIAAAIQQVNLLRESVDVIVVGRGGGSLEDLWAFNEESLVRAIYASKIPVISAVGHEIDVTLADLVADVRALTPSEAAELVVPDEGEVISLLHNHSQRLAAGLRGRALAARLRLDALANRRVFRRPLDAVHDEGRRLDEWNSRATRATGSLIRTAKNRLAGITERLEALSPLAVLGRGYTLTQRLSDGKWITASSELEPDERVLTQFASGQSISRVEKIERGS